MALSFSVKLANFTDKYHSWINAPFMLKGLDQGYLDYSTVPGSLKNNFLAV